MTSDDDISLPFEVAEAGDRQRLDLDVTALPTIEEGLQRRFDEDCRAELHSLDVASTALVHSVLQSATAESPSRLHILIEAERYVPDEPGEIMLAANRYIGSRALRAMRAGRAVLACGYESEARALDRIIVELNGHRKAILADGSGHEAVKWLKRESRRGIGKKVAELGPADMYGDLSSDSHGDPLPLYRMIDQEDGMIDLAPRRTVTTKASLLMYAGFAHDQACVLADLSRGHLSLEGMDELAEAIKAGWDRLGRSWSRRPNMIGQQRQQRAAADRRLKAHPAELRWRMRRNPLQ